MFVWPTDFAAFFSRSTLAQVGCGLLFFIGMLHIGDIKSFFKKFMPNWFTPLVSLLYMFSYPIFFWVIIYFVKYSNTYLIETGWLYEASDSAIFSSMWESYVVADVNWGVVNDLVTSSLSMTLLIWVSSMLNITGIEASAFPKGIDKDGEMLNLSLCNLLCFLSGGSPVFHQLGTSINVQMDGGTHRLAPLVSSMVVFGVWFAGAASAIQQVVPRFFLGGIFLTIGWSFFNDWLIKSRSKMSGVEYRLIIFCLFFFIVTGSIIMAIVISIAIAVGIFLLKLSITGGVKATKSGCQFRSGCARTSEEENILDKYGDRILVIKLAGVLFFGSVQTIVRRVRKAIRQERAEYVLLDFEETLYIDASSAENFKKLYLEVKGAGGLLFFVNLNTQQLYGFLRIGILPVNHENLVIEDKKDYQARVAEYKENFADFSNKGFDNDLIGVFGGGLQGNNQYPFFSEELRAKEICEDDLLYRFKYSSGESSPEVMSENVFMTQGGEDFSLERTPQHQNRQRMAKFGISDEDFFMLPLCLGLLPRIKDYVTVHSFDAGDRIFGEKEKSMSDCFVIIRQGLVEYRRAREPASCEPGNLLSLMGAGHVTRAISFMSQTGHVADFVAVADKTVLWMVSRDALRNMSTEDPPLLSMVFSSLGLSCARHVHLVSGIRAGYRGEPTNYMGFEYFQLESVVGTSDIRCLTFV